MHSSTPWAHTFLTRAVAKTLEFSPFWDPSLSVLPCLRKCVKNSPLWTIPQEVIVLPVVKNMKRKEETQIVSWWLEGAYLMYKWQLVPSRWTFGEKRNAVPSIEHGRICFPRPLRSVLSSCVCIAACRQTSFTQNEVVIMLFYLYIYMFLALGLLWGIDPHLLTCSLP